MSDTADITRRVTEFDKFDEWRTNVAIKNALETAAKAVEAMAGTRHYQFAFRKAARKIRSMKPE